MVNVCGQILSDPALLSNGITLQRLDPMFQEKYLTITMLASGFILTSLLWAWGLAASIDRRLTVAGVVFLVCAAFTLVGLMHSPLDGNRLFLPVGPESWGAVVLESEFRAKVFEFAAGYAVVGILLILWDRLLPRDLSGEPAEH